jgi:hypothetical protein
MTVRSYNYEKEMDRAYTYYARIRDSIPSYMARNLKEMPNNKGYYWRDIAYFGHLPAEKKKPIVLFDKDSRTKILTIHEWSPTEYKIFEKHGDTRKELVHKEKRKVLKLE